MITIETGQLKKIVGSEYRLVILAAKRAKQLSKEGTPLVECPSQKETIIALREIAEGKVTYRPVEAPESSESGPEDEEK